MEKIKISKCCGAVMINDNWCPCCDRPAEAVDSPREKKIIICNRGDDKEKIRQSISENERDKYEIMTEGEARLNGVDLRTTEQAYVFKVSPMIDNTKPRNRQEKRHGRKHWE